MKLSLWFLFISTIAGLFHLDVMVFGQFMFSRPIVVAPIIGILSGLPEVGLIVGIITELLYVSIIPVGIKIPPDSTTVAVLTVVCSERLIDIPVALFFAIIFGFLYKYIDIAQRSFNSLLLGWVDTAKAELVEQRVNLLIIYALFITYLKTVLFYLIVLPILSFFIKQVFCCWIKNLWVHMDLYNLIYILPAIGIGIGLAHFVEE